MIKTVIFDLGKVIVDFDLDRFAKALASKSGYSQSYVFHYNKKSKNLLKRYEKGEISSKEFFAVFKKDLNLKMDFDEFKETCNKIFTDSDKDIEKLIKKLKKGYKLVLLSNTNEIHFDFLRKKHKIINHFDELVLSHKEKCAKPSPLIFYKVLRKAKSKPWECVYIDDVPLFVFVAKMMGIKAILYKGYDSLILELRKHKVIK